MQMFLSYFKEFYELAAKCGTLCKHSVMQLPLSVTFTMHQHLVVYLLMMR